MGPRAGQKEDPDRAGRGFSVAGWGLGFALALSAGPSAAAEAGGLATGYVPLAMVLGAGALALAGALWALSERQASRNLRRTLRLNTSRARTLLGVRDSLLTSGREAVMVWGADLEEPLSFAGAGDLLDKCLAGPDAGQLSAALEALAENGTAFSLTARTAEGLGVNLRGRPAGGYAALFLEPEARAAWSETDFRAALDAVPVPVWIRGKDLSLRFVNRAYLAAAGSASADAALESDIALDRSERDLASTAKSGNEPVEAKRYAVLGGQRRALTFTLAPLPDGSIAGAALDVTPLAEAEARLQQHVDAHADTLDRLATAVAIFGADRKLNFYNRAYVRLWQLSEGWLDSRPSEGDILDRLRELRRLPEQPDFRAWKTEHLKLFERVDDHPEELWHLPGGKTLRFVAQPHPFGGLIFLYEDVSDQLRLESSYNTLIKVQKATLDTLHEGVVVFGPDGRLRLHNAAFARIWGLESSDLTGEPHLRRLAELSAGRFGADRVWEIVTKGVTAATPERRHEYGEVERSDGTIISLTLAPLPDGATLAGFADVTDRSNIETALRERNQALEKADNLKTEFVKRVSYELRTPLNSILGFAELLKAGTAGTMNVRQAEYVDDILTASHTLLDLINDILDLSQLEAGAMMLDLEQVDLHRLLSIVAEHVGDSVSKLGLTLTLQCRTDAGSFVADKKRLGQVLLNLFSNALRHTPRGGTITLGGEISGEDVQIYVSDTGSGVPADIMPSAFERFAAKGTGGHGGAGLGLALVNRFVELHNGWVELQSEPGKGTRVTCHLPRSTNAPGVPVIGAAARA
jgi:signal transduction histidine kinase